MSDVKWEPLVGTPSKPPIPPNILVPDPSPARSAISDAESPTLLPPSPNCSFIHQRRQGQYVPRPPVWRISRPDQNRERLLNSGATDNSVQERPTNLAWLLTLPGSDQPDPIQLMADVFNEKPLVVNMMAGPEVKPPPIQGVSMAPSAARGAYTGAEAVSSPISIPQEAEQSEANEASPEELQIEDDNRDEHQGLSAVNITHHWACGTNITERKAAHLELHASLFPKVKPDAPTIPVTQPSSAKDNSPHEPRNPFGMYPASEAESVNIDETPSPVLPVSEKSGPKAGTAGEIRPITISDNTLSRRLGRLFGIGGQNAERSRTAAQPAGYREPRFRPRKAGIPTISIPDQTISVAVEIQVAGARTTQRLEMSIVRTTFQPTVNDIPTEELEDSTLALKSEIEDRAAPEPTAAGETENQDLAPYMSGALGMLRFRILEMQHDGFPIVERTESLLSRDD